MDPVRVVNLVNRRPDVTLLPPSTLRLDLKQVVVAPKVVSNKAGRSGPQGGGVGRPPNEKAPSWWTQRAKTGDVTPGFTRENLTRPKAEDPRTKDGVFDRVLGVLTELSDIA